MEPLAVISPAIMGPVYFREAAEVIGAAAGGPPDRATMAEVFRRHGMTVAPPLRGESTRIRVRIPRRCISRGGRDKGRTGEPRGGSSPPLGTSRNAKDPTGRR